MTAEEPPRTIPELLDLAARHEAAAATVPILPATMERNAVLRQEPLIDPDCTAGKHGSCVGGPCQCAHHAVYSVLRELGKLADAHGPTAAAVMLLTGLTADDLDAIGGLPG